MEALSGPILGTGSPLLAQIREQKPSPGTDSGTEYISGLDGGQQEPSLGWMRKIGALPGFDSGSLALPGPRCGNGSSPLWA